MSEPDIIKLQMLTTWSSALGGGFDRQVLNYAAQSTFKDIPLEVLRGAISRSIKTERRAVLSDLLSLAQSGEFGAVKPQVAKIISKRTKVDVIESDSADSGCADLIEYIECLENLPQDVRELELDGETFDPLSVARALLEARNRGGRP